MQLKPLEHAHPLLSAETKPTLPRPTPALLDLAKDIRPQETHALLLPNVKVTRLALVEFAKLWPSELPALELMMPDSLLTPIARTEPSSPPSQLDLFAIQTTLTETANSKIIAWLAFALLLTLELLELPAPTPVLALGDSLASPEFAEHQEPVPRSATKPSPTTAILLPDPAAIATEWDLSCATLNHQTTALLNTRLLSTVSPPMGARTTDEPTAHSEHAEANTSVLSLVSRQILSTLRTHADTSTSVTPLSSLLVLFS